jgi:hypothetical protein
LAAGIRAMAVPGLADGFAAVLGAYRFLHNDAVNLPCLMQPLHLMALQWAQQSTAPYGLVIHDWSNLKYPTHTSKTDQAQLTHVDDNGYELATMLLVDGGTGSPVAPLEMRLLTAHVVHSTRSPAPKKTAFRIDEVLSSMQLANAVGLTKRLVHVIDREADSLAHYRSWHADGHLFLVRADGERSVLWRDQELSLQAVGQRLRSQGLFKRSREVNYKGQTAIQYVAETTVILHRPAWRHRKKNGKTINERIPGEPITLRLIVSRVCTAAGKTLAVWYLLTNVAPQINSATIALWYYWRWRIESFHKLLKSAGQQAEQWQQETGEAIAKRLLIASMACALVWQIERHTSPEAAALRVLLIKLSGRQMKHGKAHTTPALLAGLWVFVTMLQTLEHHTLEDLRNLKQHLGFFQEEDTG